MFFIFQTFVYELKVLQKSYTTSDHVKKILRSLPSKCRPKVTTIQKAKDLNKLPLEEFMSSLKSHEVELEEDEPNKKSKSLALKSQENKTNYKALQAPEELEESDLEDQSKESENEDLSFI